jgi:hypothetical protein
MIETTLQYAERYFPGVARTLRGASPEEIEELQEAYGHPLPSSYREFLASMGRYSGRLISELNSHDLTLRAIRSYYLEEGNGAAEFLCIGINQIGSQRNVWLYDNSGREPTVVISNPPPAVPTEGPAWPSLESMLLETIFRSIRISVLGARAAYGPQLWDVASRGTRLQVLERIAPSIGLQRAVPSGRLSACYDRPADDPRGEAAIYFYEPEPPTVYIEIAAATEQILTPFAAALDESLLLRRVG